MRRIRKRRADSKYRIPRCERLLLPWCLLLLCALLGLFVPIPAHAQEPGPTAWEWRTFTADNSPLAPGGVDQLLEDSQSRIWIGTYDGVSLYHEGAWQTFTTENSSLAMGYVTKLLEDSQGRIWVGTGSLDPEVSGVSLYQAGTWQTFTADNSQLAAGQVTVLAEDSQDRIWVGTGGGVSLYQAGAWQTFTADNSPQAPGGIAELLEDSQGRIWVGGGSGVSFYQAGAWQTFNANNSPLAPGGITELSEDSQGRIWIGTSYYDRDAQTYKGGLSLYQAGGWQTFTADNSPLAPGGVTELLEDSQGRIWAGTEGGLSLYQAGAWQTFTANNSPLTPGWISVLSEDSQGRIWVGTGGSMPDVGGVSFYQAGVWRTFTSDNSSLAPGRVTGLLEDSEGRMWIGTRDGVGLCQAGAWQTFTADNSQLAAGEITALVEDSQGRIWVGTTVGLSVYQARAWQRFTSDNSSLAPGRVTELLEDSQGRIWVGTSYYDRDARAYKSSLSLYQAGVWQIFTSDNSPLTPGGVTVLLEDSQGRIWIGTSDYDRDAQTYKGGLSLYQADDWQTFTADNSPLAPGGVTELLEDSQGRIWIGTSDYDRDAQAYKSGLSLYQADDWQTFTADNSPLAPGGVTELLEDFQGRIWVGTWGGVSLYQAGAWQTFTTENSPLAADSISALLEDSQGRIWIGTTNEQADEGGVSLYQADDWQIFTSDNSPVAPGRVNVLLEDSQGRIWVGALWGGVSLYQAHGWQTFTSENSSLAPGLITALLEDSQGRIWIRTTEGLSVYQEGAWQTFTAENSPLALGMAWRLMEDSQGRMWVGTLGGLCIRRPGDRSYAFLRYAGPPAGQTASLRTTSALTFTFPSPRSSLEIGFAGIDAESDPDRLLFRCQLIGYDEKEVPCVSPVRYPALPPGTYTFHVRALDEDLMSSEPATATITLISTALPTLTPTPAPTPTPHIIEVERMVPGLPRETVIPIIGGLGGLVIAAVLGVVIGRQVRRARRLAAWRKGADPYVVGDVIEEPERFYGREEALTELLRALEAGNHVALYGERRIGKTSLLHQLAYRLRNLPQSSVHFLPVFANLQMVSEPRFFSALAEATAKAARRELEQHKQSLPTLQVDNRREGYDSRDLADDLEVIVEVLQKAIGQSPRIVLLLDEADEMNGYAPHTQGALRGLLMMPVGRRVKLVWSGQAMNREWHLESSPWYNLFKQEIHLGGLEEEAAARLIREPVGGIFTYEDEAVRHILELTGREPYPIQRLCSFCVRRLSGKKNHFRVTADDVEAAWQDMQAEDVRRTAEGATDLTYQSSRPAWAIAEKGTKYHTGKEGEA